MGWWGWLREQGVDWLARLGRPKPAFTYPSLEESPEVQHERETLGRE
jgi:urea transport system permease protein